MIQWSYTVGRYIAQLRAMFQETLSAIQKEFEESGVDIRKDLPTIPRNFDILSEVSKVINEPPKPNNSTAPAESTPESASAETSSRDEAKPSRYDSWLPK
jgi:hypothetical protein